MNRESRKYESGNTPAPTICWVTDLQAANRAEHRQAGEAAQPEQDPTESVEGAHCLVEEPPARESLWVNQHVPLGNPPPNPFYSKSV